MTPLEKLRQEVHAEWKRAIAERNEATKQTGAPVNERVRADAILEGKVDALLGVLRLVESAVYRGDGE